MSNYRILEGDCRETLPTLPDDSVDVIVTSPPYNIGVDYGVVCDSLSWQDYTTLLVESARQAFRVLNQSGSLFLNVGAPVSHPWRAFTASRMFSGSGLHLQNMIHWIKSFAAPEHAVNIGHYKPVNSKRYLSNMHEYVFHFTKTCNVPLDKLAIGVPYKDKGNVGRYSDTDLRDRGNVWFIPYETVTGKKRHPAAFPVQLPEMCIGLHGLRDDRPLVVLDPFAGSGSTILAALGLGCDAIGCELNPKYVSLIHDRVQGTQMPLI